MRSDLLWEVGKVTKSSLISNKYSNIPLKLLSWLSYSKRDSKLVRRLEFEFLTESLKWSTKNYVISEICSDSDYTVTKCIFVFKVYLLINIIYI